MHRARFVPLVIAICANLLCLAQPLTGEQIPTDLGTRRFGDDWPRFLGPTGDSKSAEKGIIKDWSDGLPVVWHVGLTQSYGTCTVSRGRAYQFDSSPTSVGKNTARLRCLYSETGERIWEYNYPYEYSDQYGYNNGPRCSPIVDEDRIYIYGVSGRITCVGATNGEEIWSVDANQKFGVVTNFFGVGSNPVIYDDLLIVMVGGSPPETRQLVGAKGNGSGIVAFNKYTGDVVYQCSDQLASYASLQLVRDPEPWCFALMRGGLLGFDPSRGEPRFFYPWRARTPESVNASVPVVIGNRVFISETYGPGSSMLDFSRIRSGVPEVVWSDQRNSRRKSMQTHWNTAIHHGGYIYGSSGRHSGNAELRCVNADSGKVLWSKPGLARCSLLLVDNHLVCLSETGAMYLLEVTPAEYRQVSTVVLQENGQPMLRYPAWAAPVLSHGLLYVRGKDRLVCLDLIPQSE